MIPVVDLFAGPGGLGEGFNSLRDGAKRFFRVVLSIENDRYAHQTLKLRSFYRQFERGVPEDYYAVLRGTLKPEELYSRYPLQSLRADSQAWLATLGKQDGVAQSEIDRRIREAVGASTEWVLVGGPPCQAYSLVGRSRRANDPRKLENDPKHFLYEAYLRILAEHGPPVFVMENVKGILSSTVRGEKIINKILSDLENPSRALEAKGLRGTSGACYKIYPFARYTAVGGGKEVSVHNPSDYIICRLDDPYRSDLLQHFSAHASRVGTP